RGPRLGKAEPFRTVRRQSRLHRRPKDFSGTANSMNRRSSSWGSTVPAVLQITTHSTNKVAKPQRQSYYSSRFLGNNKKSQLPEEAGSDSAQPQSFQIFVCLNQQPL